jgi:hypothetical protein
VPLTAAAKKIALDAVAAGTTPTASITHVGMFRWSEAAKALTTPFGVASTDTFTSTAHGYANGDLLILTAVTGGAGLTVGDAFYVIGSTANTFQLARVSGGTAVDFTTDITAGSVRRLVEWSGGSYARVAVAWSAAAAVSESITDSTNGAVIQAPSGVTADYEAGFSALTAGTLLALDTGTGDSFASAGTYTITDVTISLPS